MCTTILKIMKNIAIFASGEGTNTERIARFFLNNCTIKVAVVITNKPNAGVLARAKAIGLHAVSLTPQEAGGDKVIEVLKQYDIDFIVLAGYLAKISDEVLHIFPNRIINIHPALLPKYGGKGMYGLNVHKAVIAANEKESGITIHYLNEKYDSGEIIFQAKCPVLPTDTPEDVATKVHALEYAHYPHVIKDLLTDQDF